MTNLPFLLQTTNFLSQSICTNIPPHQSPGARTNFHYLCNTDYKMKQKLTTAKPGRVRHHGREGGMGRGEEGWEEMQRVPRGGPRGRGGSRQLHRPPHVKQENRGGGKGMERAPKNLLEMTQSQVKSWRKMFRTSRKKGNNRKMSEIPEKRPEWLCGAARGQKRPEEGQVLLRFSQSDPGRTQEASGV